jgi:microcystin-dependent protein
MTAIYYRGDQSTELSCEQLDSNWDAVRERGNHTGTQLASTISNLKTTVEGYDFIAALQECCEDLTTQLTELQDSIFGDGELSTLITNLKNELLQDIAEVQTDLTALTTRVTTTETNIATINTTLSSLSSSITGLANSKANIASPTFTGVPKAPTPSIGADSNQIVTVGYLNLLGGLLPIGSVVEYSASAISDPNFVMANGQAINRVTYAGYFALVGTTYGVGDGTTTFNVPDRRKRVGVGAGTGYTLGATGGAATHTLTTDEMPTHSHTADHTHTTNETPHTHTTAALLGTTGDGDSTLPYHLASVGYAATPIALVNSATTGITVNSASVTTSNQGSGQAHNNMQPYIVLNYIVKVK